MKLSILLMQLHRIFRHFKRVIKQFPRGIRDQINYKFSVKITTLEELYGDSLEKIYPIEPETVKTSELKNMVLWSTYEGLKQDTYQTPEIYTTILNDVIFHPDTGALFTIDKQIIFDSLFEIRRNQRSYILKLQNIINNANDIETITGQCALYRTYGAFGHQMIDSMARLYLLDQEAYGYFPKIKLLYPKPLGELENYFFSRMTASNITPTPVEKDTLYHIKRLIFPSFLTKDGGMYLPQSFMNRYQQQILPQRPRNKNKRIFVSRERQKQKKGRHVINEIELMTALEKHGFKKYTLEDMTIVEVIDLFYDAEIVIAAEGSGSCHIVFSESIDVIILSPSIAICPHCYFLSISPNLQHNIRYWHGQNNGFNTNFEVDIDQITQILEEDFQIV